MRHDAAIGRSVRPYRVGVSSGGCGLANTVDDNLPTPVGVVDVPAALSRGADPRPAEPAKAQRPILVLDSGLGGLTVVAAMRAALPQEDIVYFGDTARLPYGSKSAATVTSFVKQIIHNMIPRHQPKHVVIACNTATALALASARAQFPHLTISGVIEPGSKAAVEAAGSKDRPTIGVIATEATIRSGAYERAIHRRRTAARLLLQPAPLLVPIIEDGRGGDDPLVRIAVEQYLSPLISRQVDVLVLGCTHYPIIAPLIRQTVGVRVRVIDSAERCAHDVAARLASQHLLRAGGAAAGGLRCYVSDDAARFRRLASRFLGYDIDEPTLVPPDNLGPVPEPIDYGPLWPRRSA